MVAKFESYAFTFMDLVVSPQKFSVIATDESVASGLWMCIVLSVCLQSRSCNYCNKSHVLATLIIHTVYSL